MADPGAYNTLGNSQLYDFGSNSTGVVNLTPGQVYELQIFMFDDRTSQDKTFDLSFTQASLSANGVINSEDASALGLVSIVNLGGGGVTTGVYATATFSIDAPYDGLRIKASNGGGFVSGIQLREVPEPGSLALLGLGGFAMAGRRRR